VGAEPCRMGEPGFLSNLCSEDRGKKDRATSPDNQPPGCDASSTLPIWRTNRDCHSFHLQIYLAFSCSLVDVAHSISGWNRKCYKNRLQSM
jgi:hypothetical protein